VSNAPDYERSEQYRNRARQLRLAAKGQELRPETRDAMLELALNYERLADLLEQLP
jgi:hypothetical protein